ncbi:MAG: hypothetical protein KC535_03065 [Nanoarchaeota archaeon]|nr:hypothetical protein [Nanoarchaeota archaeon]
MIFSSKRGMSPLIATVLLIAFAVAMGAMIMNWSAGIEGEGEGMPNYCEGISISTNQGACFSNNAISFNVVNNGDQKVDGILLSSLADGTSIDIKIKDTALIKGENIDKNVPYLYSGGSVELEFVPLVVENGEVVECRNGGFSQTELPTC